MQHTCTQLNRGVSQIYNHNIKFLVNPIVVWCNHQHIYIHILYVWPKNACMYIYLYIFIDIYIYIYICICILDIPQFTTCWLQLKRIPFEVKSNFTSLFSFASICEKLWPLLERKTTPTHSLQTVVCIRQLTSSIDSMTTAGLLLHIICKLLHVICPLQTWLANSCSCIPQHH